MKSPFENQQPKGFGEDRNLSEEAAGRDGKRRRKRQSLRIDPPSAPLAADPSPQDQNLEPIEPGLQSFDPQAQTGDPELAPESDKVAPQPSLSPGAAHRNVAQQEAKTKTKAPPSSTEGRLAEAFRTLEAPKPTAKRPRRTPPQNYVLKRAREETRNIVSEAYGEDFAKGRDWAKSNHLPQREAEALQRQDQAFEEAVLDASPRRALQAFKSVDASRAQALEPASSRFKLNETASHYRDVLKGRAEDIIAKKRRDRAGRSDAEADAKKAERERNGEGALSLLEDDGFLARMAEEYEAQISFPPASAQPPVVKARYDGGKAQRRPAADPDAPRRKPISDPLQGAPETAAQAAGAGIAAAGRAAVVAAGAEGSGIALPVGRLRGGESAERSLKSALRKSGLAIAADVALDPNLPGMGGLSREANFDFENGLTLRVAASGVGVGDGGPIGVVRGPREGASEEILLASLTRGDGEDPGALFIPGAESIGPVARIEDGFFSEKRVVLLRPDLFSGAAEPGEAERRAKRLLLAPLIFGGRLPGHGEGVSAERFEEAFDPPVLEIGPLVTPLPEARGPELTITPDESDRIARQYLDWAQKGGFSPAPDELRRPLVLEIRAPQGGLNEGNAWGLLDQVRGKLDAHPLITGGVRRAGPRNLPALGDDLPGSDEGTAAVVQVGGQIFVGVNSGALNDRWENLTPGRLIKEELRLGRGDGRAAFHAESDALIRAYFRTKGALPPELTLYVDRDTCDGCQKILPAVLDAIGVDKLEIVMKSGERETILKGPVKR